MVSYWQSLCPMVWEWGSCEAPSYPDRLGLCCAGHEHRCSLHSKSRDDLYTEGRALYMPGPITTLIVDDEAEIRDMLEEYLTKQGVVVHTADGGETMRQIVSEYSIDVVVLDVRMPGEDGLSLARFLREHYRIGIIMLTAAGEVIDRIIGLEMGADDYLAKPFDPRELLARIKSVIRRMKPVADVASETVGTDAQQVRFGHCILDLDSHQLFTLEGEEIPITSMEFDLLHALSTHPNRVLTRDQLLDMAHHRGWEPFDRSIDIRIARLRRKIESNPAKPQLIRTIRGQGYMFVA
jgi:DNA-binding response OmpR family regulator